MQMSPIHDFEMKFTFVIANLELVDIFFPPKVVGYKTLDEIRLLDSVQLEFFNLYILFTKSKDRVGKKIYIYTDTHTHTHRKTTKRDKIQNEEWGIMIHFRFQQSRRLGRLRICFQKSYQFVLSK